MFIKKRINGLRYRRSLMRMEKAGGIAVEAQATARDSGKPEDLEMANSLVRKFDEEQAKMMKLGRSIGKTIDELIEDIHRVSEQIGSEHPDHILGRLGKSSYTYRYR